MVKNAFPETLFLMYLFACLVIYSSLYKYLMHRTRYTEKSLILYADNEDPDQPKWGLCCPITESVDTVKYYVLHHENMPI